MLPAEKMTLNKETSNEAFGNKLPFSVRLCMRVYLDGNTDSDVYEIEFIDIWNLESGFHIFYQRMKSLQFWARRLANYEKK